MSHSFRCSQVRENGVLAWRGSARPTRPDEGATRGEPRGRHSPETAPTGHQNIHLTRLAYTRYCHSGGLW
jgi:hypothetical protein